MSLLFKLRTGCVSLSYKDWEGPFYPAGMEPKHWLSFYRLGLRQQSSALLYDGGEGIADIGSEDRNPVSFNIIT